MHVWLTRTSKDTEREHASCACTRAKHFETYVISNSGTVTHQSAVRKSSSAQTVNSQPGAACLRRKDWQAHQCSTNRQVHMVHFDRHTCAYSEYSLSIWVMVDAALDQTEPVDSRLLAETQSGKGQGRVLHENEAEYADRFATVPGCPTMKEARKYLGQTRGCRVQCGNVEASGWQIVHLFRMWMKLDMTSTCLRMVHSFIAPDRQLDIHHVCASLAWHDAASTISHGGKNPHQGPTDMSYDDILSLDSCSNKCASFSSGNVTPSPEIHP